MRTQPPPLQYDPFDLAVREDPYRHYAQLRAEAPVFRAERSKTWVISRYDDVVSVLKDTVRFSNDAVGRVQLGATAEDASAEAGGSGDGPMPGNLVTCDPPDHSRLRAIVNRAFTPRRVEGWRPMVAAATDAAIAAMVQKPRFDAIADLAAIVPVTVIAEILGIGVERRADFKRWADTITASMSGSKRRLGAEASGAKQAGRELVAHLSEVLAARTKAPGDDLMSVLTRASEGEVLTATEVLGFAGVLTFAGTETTTNLIGNAVRVLIERPDVRARVLADRRLVTPLLEETLRWDAPVQYLFRRAREDVAIAGTHIPANAFINLLIGSANRDEARWGADASAFDLDRNTSGHLAFGVGAHFCLGAALARMEAECSVIRLLPLIEKSRWTGGELLPIDSIQFRGVRSLEFERV
jgi:cytochrome P450